MRTKIPVKNIRILLVDDDNDDAFIVKDLLDDSKELHDSKVDIVNNFDKAMELCKSIDYEIILIDYKLGERDGLELLQAIREEGIMSPIIMLTGNGNERLAVKAMKAGAADYFPKSEISSNKLTKTIVSTMNLYKQFEYSLEEDLNYFI